MTILISIDQTVYCKKNIFLFKVNMKDKQIDQLILFKSDLVGSFPQEFIFDDAPLLVYWGSTRACDLACIHCRAEAVPFRSPNELKTAEVKTLFNQLATFEGDQKPRIVITGGDPLMRPDLYELIEYGAEIRLDISVTPAGTERLTENVLKKIKFSGATGLGLSLDGSNAFKHDSIRMVAGSFDRTSEACRAAVGLGFPVQINSMVTNETLADIPEIFELIKSWGIARWALFFLIPTGRGQTLSEITAQQSERFLNDLCKIMATSPFPIKTTEAHHFRRIAYLKMKNRGLSDQQILHSPLGRGFGIRDANGIVFISHTGEVNPSGFLPLVTDNVRRTPITEIYKNNPIFKSLRNLDELKGKCGRCEFRAICGGSRSRAYALTGDALESDSLCIYDSSNAVATN